MTTQVIDIDPEKLIASEHNLRDVKASDVAELALSIKEVGVVVPLVVTLDESSTESEPKYRIVAGHRRALASLLAGAQTVPCVVRDDVIGKHADLEVMLLENVNRRDLSAAEEADGYKQLALLGVGVSVMALATGRPAETIAKAITAAEAPKSSAVAATYDLSMEQLIAISEFEDDPHALAELTTVARQEPAQFDHQLARTRQESTRRRLTAEKTAELVDKGVLVLAERPGWDGPIVRLEELATDKGSKITAAAHAKCPGHAVFVQAYYDGRVELTNYCVDFKANKHRKMTTSGSTVGGKLSDDELAKRRASRAHKALFVAATAVRREFVRALCDRKSLPTAIVPLVWLELAQNAYVTNRQLRPYLKALREIYAELGGNADDEGASALTSGPRLVSEVLRLLAAESEHSWAHDYTSGVHARYLRLLVAAGYTAADVENEMLAEFDARELESAQRLAGSKAQSSK